MLVCVTHPIWCGQLTGRVVAVASYLLVIGDREALAWILTEARMAFPAYRRREVADLKTGDDLFLYTTRGCFRNPTRDRGRVIGLAKALEPPTQLSEPVTVAGREFELGCSIKLSRLTPYPDGVELAPLIPELDSFPNKHGWATSLRRPLFFLEVGDARLLAGLMTVRRQPSDAIPGYVTAARIAGG